ncbi:MAG: ABC transporter ATP-binding protein [Corynebacteriales bacterium]|nr:ABC transporter ATP-binding protein [Mycobacteriales bacterium]
MNDVTYTYPDGTRALGGMSLTIGANERVALLGPNGAGKTTAVLHLAGVLTPSTGVVKINDTIITKKNIAQLRSHIGIVFQDPDDQLFMPTVGEDVAFGPHNLGLDNIAERVEQALATVGLRHVADRHPHHLSYGQRRRAAIAGVLAMEPKILVLDEPTSNLDPASRRELTDIISKLTATIIIVTHDLPYAHQLCERSLIVDSGRIVADGPTTELLANDALLAHHRLELPYLFAPRAVPAATRQLPRPRSQPT